MPTPTTSPPPTIPPTTIPPPPADVIEQAVVQVLASQAKKFPRLVSLILALGVGGGGGTYAGFEIGSGQVKALEARVELIETWKEEILVAQQQKAAKAAQAQADELQALLKRLRKEDADRKKEGTP